MINDKTKTTGMILAVNLLACGAAPAALAQNYRVDAHAAGAPMAASAAGSAGSMSRVSALPGGEIAMPMSPLSSLAPAPSAPGLAISAAALPAAGLALAALPAASLPAAPIHTAATAPQAATTFAAKRQLAVAGEKIAAAAAKGDDQSGLLNTFFAGAEANKNGVLSPPQGPGETIGRESHRNSLPAPQAGRKLHGPMSALLALGMPSAAVAFQERPWADTTSFSLFAPVVIMVLGIVAMHAAEILSRRRSEPLRAKKVYKRQLLAVSGVTGVSFYDHADAWDPRGQEKHVYVDFNSIVALMNALIPSKPADLGSYHVIPRLSSSGMRRLIHYHRRELLQIPGVVDVSIRSIAPDLNAGNRHGNFIDIRFLSEADMKSALDRNLIPKRFMGLENYVVDVAVAGR